MDVKKIAITGITAGLCLPLALFAIILVPIPGLPAASGFWIPAGFYFVMTLWFGLWGALGGHIATTIAMGYFFGYTLHIWMNGGIGDLIAPLVCLIIFKVTKARPDLRARKDIAVWVVAVVISSLVCGLWVHTIHLFFGIITWPSWYIGVLTYLIGDTMAVLAVGTPLLKSLTDYVKQSPMYIWK
ncbi:MAG: hypothetical protein DRJ49_06915 [Thermoprotei archaeon]|nr:MAG: hypothetical protein DRJ49_06915 [Thermoprotei archaeon]